MTENKQYLIKAIQKRNYTFLTQYRNEGILKIMFLVKWILHIHGVKGITDQIG